MTGRRSILLVAGLDRRRDQTRLDDQPYAWHVDALLVALARSASARYLRILMPPDARFAPLVADVVAEYVGPREAEPGDSSTGSPGRATRPMGLVVMAKRSAKADASSDTRVRSSSEVFQPYIALGALEQAPLSLDDEMVVKTLRGVILVGNGPQLRRARSLARENGIRLCHVLGSASLRESRARLPSGPEVVATLAKELELLQPEVKVIRCPENESREQHIEASEPEPAAPPADFWRYPAYSLLADRLLPEIDDKELPTPSIGG